MSYMINMISPSDEDIILEPCGGEGIFIDGLLKINPTLHIDSLDLDPNSFSKISETYKNFPNVKIRCADTLLDDVLDGYSNTGHYTKIIGNPPYGAWQDYERRDLLKEKFKKISAKETYALFLARCIGLLKNEGMLSFIIPDTFLYIRSHTELRSLILLNTKIKEIAIFKSSLFPNVSYGYSKMCIITLEKTGDQEQALSNQFVVKTGFTKDSDLIDGKADNLTFRTLTQQDVYSNANHVFLLTDSRFEGIITNCENTLGNMASCVTGLCTGDNKRFYKVSSHDFKCSADYEIVKNNEINENWKSIEGISNPAQCYIPIVKGSTTTGYKRKKFKWYIKWDTDAVYEYHNFEKARFQNPEYYFRRGIAITMVKSTKIRATLIENDVFDQSIVGIFPFDSIYINYLLAVLNSSIFNELLHIINPTANNSANYVKRIPIPLPNSDELKEINDLVDQILMDVDNSNLERTIDSKVERLYRSVASAQ